MQILLYITILLNIITILILFSGLLIKFKTPKNKALFGYFMIGVMFMFLIFSIICFVAEIFIYNFINLNILFLCILSPFVIGHLANQKQITFYTVLQIIFFSFSLLNFIFI